MSSPPFSSVRGLVLRTQACEQTLLPGREGAGALGWWVGWASDREGLASGRSARSRLEKGRQGEATFLRAFRSPMANTQEHEMEAGLPASPRQAALWGLAWKSPPGTWGSCGSRSSPVTSCLAFVGLAKPSGVISEAQAP